MRLTVSRWMFQRQRLSATGPLLPRTRRHSLQCGFIEGNSISASLQSIGQARICPGVAAQRHTLASFNGDDVLAGASHIALMRPVELVVKYMRGAAYPDSLHEWAGVLSARLIRRWRKPLLRRNRQPTMTGHRTIYRRESSRRWFEWACGILRTMPIHLCLPSRSADQPTLRPQSCSNCWADGALSLTHKRPRHWKSLNHPGAVVHHPRRASGYRPRDDRTLPC